jgi:hypothetical protein
MMKKKIVKVLFVTISIVFFLWGLGSCYSFMPNASSPDGSGSYTPMVESNLKSAYTQRFGSPAGTLNDGTTYWVTQAGGRMVFSLGKERFPDAESGYILTLVCSLRGI